MHPPRLALWIVERATPSRDREAVTGDLIEDFYRIAETNPAAARRWCRRQALRSLTPGLRRRWHDAAAFTSPSSSKGRFSMRGFLRDVRFGLRLVRHQPLMAVAGMLSLAVGLGLNVLLFTLANAILFRPLPLEGADRLVMVQSRHAEGLSMDFSYPAFETMRNASGDVFDTFVAYGNVSASARINNGAATTLSGEYVSGNFFVDLGVPMRAGRALMPGDDRPDAQPAIVVSHAFWRRHFGDAPLAGQTVLLNQTHFAIIGIAHPSFFGTEIGRGVDFWVPIGQMMALEQQDYRHRPTVSWLALMARLKPGVSSDAAAARLDPVLAAFFTQLGFGVQKIVLADGSQGDSDLARNIGSPLKLLMAASLFVLLIACVNVANLQLARAAARRQELAVRAALGAARARLVSLLVADAFILTVPSGLLAIGAAAIGKDRAAQLIARWGEPVTLAAPIDARVVLAAFGLTVAASLLVGGISAWLSTRRSPSLALAEGGRSGIGGAPLTQRALVVVQFALSMTLVGGAAMLVRTVSELRGADLGFSRDVALVEVAPGQSGYTAATLPRYYSAAYENIARTPGVESVAFAHVMPLDFGGSRQTIDIQGYTPQKGESMEHNFVRVSPRYFAVMGIPLVAGREFDDRDTADAPVRMVINETMAKMFWPDGQALGGRARFFSGPDPAARPYDVEVIGIAADVRYRMVKEEKRPTFYLSTSQRPFPFGVFHVRTSGAPEARLGDIQRAVTLADPRVPVARAFTLNGQLDRNIADERMAQSIGLSLGIAALVLAATGLYATMAFVVRRRAREIGLRMALGADVSNVRAMILRQGLTLVAAGALTGAIGAYWAGRALESQLYGITPGDAASFAGAALALGAAALVATWLPARRAMRVDPITALRES